MSGAGPAAQPHTATYNMHIKMWIRNSLFRVQRTKRRKYNDEWMWRPAAPDIHLAQQPTTSTERARQQREEMGRESTSKENSVHNFIFYDPE